MTMTLTVNPWLLPVSIGGTAKMLNKVIDSAVSSVLARIVEDEAADGVNIVQTLESEEALTCSPQSSRRANFRASRSCSVSQTPTHRHSRGMTRIFDDL